MKAELKKRIPLAIAVVSGAIAILLLNIYLRKREVEIWTRMKQEEEAAAAAKPKITMGVVIIAQKDIPAQTPITAEDLTFKQLPTEYIQPGAVTALEQVIGQISSSPISAEEQILGIKLIPAGNIGKSLAEMTPEGKRAITVAVENMANIASLLKPGDYVDIFAFIALPNTGDAKSKEKPTSRLISLFQNVQVLAIGNETVSSTGKEKNKSGGTAPQTVTFALTPQEGALLAFVQENGKIKLSLRSAQDANVDQVAPADWDTLLNHLSTQPGGDGIGGPVVEIYRGLQKEVVPLSNSNNKK